MARAPDTGSGGLARLPLPDDLARVPPTEVVSSLPRPARKGIERTVFATSRLLDFFSEKELTAQTGHAPGQWPLVILKELADNALDACEEAGTAPETTITVDASRITVTDNGPGIPPETVAGVLDYSVRISSREACTGPSAAPPASSPCAASTPAAGGTSCGQLGTTRPAALRAAI